MIGTIILLAICISVVGYVYFKMLAPRKDPLSKDEAKEIANTDYANWGMWYKHHDQNRGVKHG